MNRKLSVKSFILTMLFWVLSCLSALSWSAGLTAQLSQSSIVVNQPVTLTLTAQDSSASMPDLTPLEKDFQIRGMSQSSQTRIINGSVSQSKSWILTLLPKATGQLTIPVLSSGSLSSEAVTLNVLDAGNNAANTQPIQPYTSQPNAYQTDPQQTQSTSSPRTSASNTSQPMIDVVMTTDSAKQHYVFQEIPITVTITTNQTLQQVSLIEPTIGNVELTQTGEDKVETKQVNGQKVTQLTRQYVIQPQQAGNLNIPPFTLKGRVQTQGRNQFGFDVDEFFTGALSGNVPIEDLLQGGLFNRGEAFRTQSNALSLSIKANPNAKSGEWFLPAKQVTLSDAWTPVKPTFAEGESVTRTIELVAVGAKAEQLPEINLPDVEGAKVYIDSNTTSEKNQKNHTGSTTVATRRLTLSIIPTRGGDIILPELSVKWLDTQTDTVKKAKLPAQTIQSIGAIKAPEQANSQVQSQSDNDAETHLNTNNQAVSSSTLTDKTVWLVGLLGIGILAFIALIIFKRRNRQLVETHDLHGSQNAELDLTQAVKQDDVKAAYQALLSLKQENQLSGTELSELNKLIKRIEASLYASGKSQRESDTTLLQAITSFLATGYSAKPVRKDDTKLAPLYRNHG